MRFPEDLVPEILRRVPPKSLVRFKLVSKRWFKLLSHPNFFDSPPEIILLTQKLRSYYTYHHLRISSVGDALNNKAEVMDYQLKDLGENSEIFLAGACNGLLLIQTTSYSKNYKILVTRGGNATIFNQLYVCNPFTSQTLELDFPITNHYCYYWSLVFDVSSEKYKVIAISRPNVYPRPHDYRCYVFTLPPPPPPVANISMTKFYELRQHWRELVRPQTRDMVSSTPLVMVNNDLHWFTQSKQSDQIYIEAINLAKEEFQHICIPPSVSQGRCRLLEMNGSLHMTNAVSNNQLNIWVLDDRVKRSWTLAYNIDFASIENRPENLTAHRYMGLVTVQNSEEIFMSVSRRVMSFNIKTRKWRFLFEDRGFIFLSAYPHLRSLVDWH